MSDHFTDAGTMLGKWELDRVYCADALDLLRGLPDESVDLVVTSPPYNLRNSTGNGLRAENNKGLWTNQPMRHGYSGGEYTDDMPHDDYVSWQRRCIDEMTRVIKPTGAIFYNHKWRVQDGFFQRLGDEIVAGFALRQIIIWNRNGGINFNDQYFLPSYEIVYLIAGAEFRLQPGASGYKDVWEIRPSENKNHPNSFPERLVERCLLAGGPEGSVVVDPFAGVGTVADVARRTNRHFIVGDISEFYTGIARTKLSFPTLTPLFTEDAP